MKKFFLFLFLLFCVKLSFAEGKKLNEILHDESSITFRLSGPCKFNAFRITNPLRLVVDFTDAEHNLKTKEIIAKDNRIFSKIRSGQFQNEPIKIARVVVELKSDVNYELRAENSTVYLNFVTEEKAQKEPAQAAPVPLAEVEESTDLKPVEVIAVPIEEEPSDKKKEKPMNVAPQSVKTTPLPKLKEPKHQEQKVPASKPTTLTPVKKKETRPQKTVLPKTLVSFDFHEADIRDVLRVLSAQSGINIIHGTDVAGSITITLKKVPFDQAFNTILTLGNLVSQEVGTNILRVMTPAALTQERAHAVTFTKLFPLNYAKAEDVKTQLDAIRSAEGRKGIITVDARTNTLVITDTPEGLENASRLIAEIDKKPYQVQIEAKIVEVNLDKKIDLGINWSYARSNISGGEHQYVGKTQATVGGTSRLYHGMPPGASRVEDTGPMGGGTGVNFPATPVLGQLAGISFGVISDNVRLNAMLSMLASKGVTKLLSNPKVTTLNNQEAKILVGERVPYVQQTTQLGTGAGGVTSEVQWLEIGIKLTVTPTINADKQITLKVYPQVTLLSRVTAAGPVVGTREAQTTVMIKDNETVVIGGLIEEEDIKSAAKVPLLGDIPILGHLFRRSYDSKERSELLVFITPQIISE